MSFFKSFFLLGFFTPLVLVSSLWGETSTTTPLCVLQKTPRTMTRGVKAIFQYSSTQLKVNYECKLNEQAFEPCGSSSTKIYSHLQEGSHTFTLRCKKGEQIYDRSYSWKVYDKSSAPEIQFIETPSFRSNESFAMFRFRVIPKGASLVKTSCKLNNKPFVLCENSFSSMITDGHYTFMVKSRDSLGRIGRKTYSFQVEKSHTSYIQGHEQILSPPLTPITSQLKFNTLQFHKNYSPSSVESPLAEWTVTKPEGYTLSHYEVSVGTSPGKDNVLSWSYEGKSISSQLGDKVSPFTLFFVGANYYFNVRAISSDNTQSEVISKMWRVISPGSLTFLHFNLLRNWTHNNLTTPTALWDTFKTEGYTLSHYEVSVGTSEGKEDVIGWKNIGLTHSYQFQNLPPGTLDFQKKYYFNLKAVSIDNDEVIIGKMWEVKPDVKVNLTLKRKQKSTLASSLQASFQVKSKKSFFERENYSISRYEMALGTSPRQSDIVNWQNIGNATTWQFTNLTLTPNKNYYVTLRLTDSDNQYMYFVSRPWMKKEKLPVAYSDNPITPGVRLESLTFATTPLPTQFSSPLATWSATIDDDSTLLRYEISVGTTQGGTEKFAWSPVGALTSHRYNFSSSGMNPPPFEHSTDYYFNVRAVYERGGQTLTSDPISKVWRGKAPLIFTPLTLEGKGFLFQSPRASWQVSKPQDYSLSHYEVSIGTSLGEDDVISWLNVGSVLTYQFNNIDPKLLKFQKEYFFNVRSVSTTNDITVIGRSWSLTLPVTVALSLTESATETSSPRVALKSKINTDIWKAYSDYKVPLCEMAIGTEAGDHSVHDWLDIGSSKSWKFESIQSLVTNTDYYITLRLKDNRNKYFSFVTESWQIPPSCVLSSKPESSTKNPQASFTFDEDSNVSYECRLDGGSFETCSSPQTYNLTAEGNHSFELKCTSSGGQPSSTTYTWNLDKTAPVITFTKTPGNHSSQNIDTFEFQVTETGSGVKSIKCRLNNRGSFQTCSSPYTTSNLSEGDYSLDVEVTDNVGLKDKITHFWTVDRTAPVITLTEKPAKVSTATGVEFIISIAEAGSLKATRCRFNNEPLKSCIPFIMRKDLTPGEHSFYFEAEDQAGLKGSISYTWTVEGASSRVCAIENGVGEQRAENKVWLPCEPTSCDTGYTKNTAGFNACLPTQDPFSALSWHFEQKQGDLRLEKFFDYVDHLIGPNVKPGIDINFKPIIPLNITGSGVVVGVSDSDIEVRHEDLAANYNKTLSKNFRNCDSDPNSKDNYDCFDPWLPGSPHNHGTRVAGVIVAASNSVGSKGVASGAKFAGFNILSSSNTIVDRLQQINVEGIDVFSYSWGWGVPYYRIPPGIKMQEMAFKDGVTRLRDGKGIVYVRASSNDYFDWINITDGIRGWGNTAYGELVSWPYLIIVSGINQQSGHFSVQTNKGSNLWITAPTRIITTDVQGCSYGHNKMASALDPNCKYDFVFGGSSASTPVITGVVALMLDANPNLTWRDVKHILAKTARKDHDTRTGSITHPGVRYAPFDTNYTLSNHTYAQRWVTNAAGFSFHNWYGFGLVDTNAAVRMALNYSENLGEFSETVNKDDDTWFYSSGTLIDKVIPRKDATGVTNGLEVKHNFVIESVQIKISAEHKYVGNLGLELTSPSGTKSIILNINSNLMQHPEFVINPQGSRDFEHIAPKPNYNDMLLASHAFYGENSKGNWTIKLIDGGYLPLNENNADTNPENQGKLTNWKINIIGHKPVSPTDITPPFPVTNLTLTSQTSSLTSTPHFNFTNSTSSDVLRYEASLGTSVGDDDIVSWLPVFTLETSEIQNQTMFKFTNLTLNRNTTYYINVRAVDESENVSSVVHQIFTTITN